MSSSTAQRLFGATGMRCLAASAFVVGSVITPAQTLALPGASESTVVTIVPTRVLDTRYNIGLDSQVVAGVARNMTMTGIVDTYLDATSTTVVKQVVPTGATGVLLNVTAVSPTAAGFLSIRPGTAASIPATVGLNFVPGDVVPNAVTVALPTTGTNKGQIDIYYGTPTTGAVMHVIVDVVGYTTNTGLIDLVNRVTALETDGTDGEAGPVNRINNEQIATLAWYDDPGIAGPIAVGRDPFLIATDGTNIYVTNFGENTVSVINPIAKTVIETMTLVSGDGPEGIVYDGTNIWIAGTGDFATKLAPPLIGNPDRPVEICCFLSRSWIAPAPRCLAAVSADARDYAEAFVDGRDAGWREPVPRSARSRSAVGPRSSGLWNRCSARLLPAPLRYDITCGR
jgi:YVTN family beta-propeller protein